MTESDFSLEKARESRAFLREDFPKRLWGPSATKDLSTRSIHYISYVNSLRLVEGTLLRQVALRFRAEAEILKNGNASVAALQKAEAHFGDAAAIFCDFVQASDYAD